MMGKKSRQKKEKRLARQNVEFSTIEEKETTNKETPDTLFKENIARLRDFLYGYRAEDVCISLNISDLWLPNISSQVKHYFAMSVFLSSEADSFNRNSRIQTYEAFETFLKGLYKLLPSFAMYEDYVPELDWGEIKIESRKEYLRIFYGGSIECISDYLETFKIFFENTAIPEFNNACLDLHKALEVQNYILDKVDRSLQPKDIEIRPGHIEVPALDFWIVSNKALTSLSNDPIYWEVSKPLLHEFGSYKIPSTHYSFFEGFFNSIYLSGIAVNVENKLFPLSLRNSLSVILDYWGSKLEKLPNTLTDVFHKNFKTFLFNRFDDQSFIIGPSRFVTKTKTYSTEFFCIFFSGQKVYLFTTYNADVEKELLQIEAEFIALGKSGERWAMLGREENLVYEINVDPKNLEIILVIPKVTTTMAMAFPIDDFKGRMTGLRELVGILDSVENAKEFEEFWKYYDDSIDMLSPMSGLTDIFGSFRDSDNVLVEGALSYDMVVIDPHWGSNWRFNELKEFWLKAPTIFPEFSNIAWKLKGDSSDSRTLISKNGLTLYEYIQIEMCSVFFSFKVDLEDLDILNGRILELVVDCIADSCATRAHLIKALPIFEKRRIVTELQVDSYFRLSEDRDLSEEDFKAPVFNTWRIDEDDVFTIKLTVNINLQHAQFYLTDPKDSYFEAKILIEWIKGISEILKLEIDQEIISRVKLTETQRPRYTLSRHERTIDVPDFGTKCIPKPTQYKLARKQMAISFKAIGAAPGRYELDLAKNIIDKARDEFRTSLHTKVSEFNRNQLILFCIEQIDILLASYQREIVRVRSSLKHEVDFDRPTQLADIHQEHIRNSKNYRYLLEVALSAADSGKRSVTENDVLELIAFVDWLFVMYGASDVLHNGIEVSGVEVDETFIPHVFYSHDRDIQEEIFGLEAARNRLGIDLNSDDEVNPNEEEDVNWEKLDKAFLNDIGFSFTNLCSAFLLLSKWASIHDQIELKFFYRSKKREIIQKLIDTFEDITMYEAENIIDFVILDPSKVRRLEGRNNDESDVPTWEHNKRTNRLTIKPLLPIGDYLVWGPSMARKSYAIWRNSISEGYLPADYPWENVKKVVRTFKESIEKKLEVKAHEIILRSTKFAMHGIDFKRRFEKENFDDVGDYDVLAYWPEYNSWLSIEAKYNQPPYCLKDGRRLRERIFGTEKDRGQFQKIELRRQFLVSHLDKLRVLLGWPDAENGESLNLHDIYVSRDIYWWMRNPPYFVSTEFIRVDGLNSWLKNYLDTLKKINEKT